MPQPTRTETLKGYSLAQLGGFVDRLQLYGERWDRKGIWRSGATDQTLLVRRDQRYASGIEARWWVQWEQFHYLPGAIVIPRPRVNLAVIVLQELQSETITLDVYDGQGRVTGNVQIEPIGELLVEFVDWLVAELRAGVKRNAVQPKLTMLPRKRGGRKLIMANAWVCYQVHKMGRQAYRLESEWRRRREAEKWPLDGLDGGVGAFRKAISKKSWERLQTSMAEDPELEDKLKK